MPRVAGISQFEQTQWAGGLNLRDAPGELDDNESPDCLNVTFDDTGAVVKRLGIVDDTASDLGDSDAATWTLFYSEVLGKLVLQLDDKVYRRDSTETYTLIHTFASTPGQMQFADFNGLLYFVAPGFGVYSYNGTTVTLRNSTVRGSALVAWQNKLWATGDGNTVVSRVWWSAAGDGNTWTTGTDFVDLRDGNDAKTTALCVAGTGALLVFKDHSTHRITDSTTGANSTIDPSNGACGSKAVSAHQGIVCTVNSHGVYLTDGLSELQHVSDKLNPLFTPTALSVANRSHWCIGHYQDRFLISLRRLGQTYNDLTLEFHPGLGWFTAHSFGLSAVSPLGDNTETTYGIIGRFEDLRPGQNQITRIMVRDDGGFGDPVGGTFTLTFEAQTTGTIAYNASAATVQTALEALSNIAPGDVSVTDNGVSGTETLDQLIEFTGALALSPRTLTMNTGGLTGSYTTEVTNSYQEGSASTSPYRRVFEIFTGGDDDGYPINCYFYTKSYLLERNNLCRLRHIRVDGRGSFDFCVRRDYESGDGQKMAIEIEDSDGFLWGTGIWGAAVWGGTTFAGTDNGFSFGTARRVQFCLRQSGSSSAVAPTMLRSGPSKEIGEVALNGLVLDYVRLGLA